MGNRRASGAVPSLRAKNEIVARIAFPAALGMAGKLPLPVEHMASILAALTTLPLRDQAWIRLAMNCGFRVREIMSLNVSHVWDAGRVKTLIRLERAHLKGGRGKRRRTVTSRTVPLNAAITPVLEQYLFARFGAGNPSRDEPLFPSRNYGGRISRWRANEIIHDLLRAAGVPDINFYGTHSCRKAFCREIYRASRNCINITRAAMAHVSVSTTQKYLAVNQSEIDSCIMMISHPSASASIQTNDIPRPGSIPAAL